METNTQYDLQQFPDWAIWYDRITGRYWAALLPNVNAKGLVSAHTQDELMQLIADIGGGTD